MGLRGADASLRIEDSLGIVAWTWDLVGVMVAMDYIAAD